MLAPREVEDLGSIELPKGVIRGASETELAIWRPKQVVEFASTEFCAFGQEQLTIHRPQLDRGVQKRDNGAGRQDLPIRGPADGIDNSSINFENSLEFSGLIPQPDGLIKRTRGKPLSIGRPGDSNHAIAVPP